MANQQWRPSAAHRKRHAESIAVIDSAGFGGIMLFFLVLFMLPAKIFNLPVSAPVDLPYAAHANAEPGALKEDAIDVAVTRNGAVYICGTKVRSKSISDEIRRRLSGGSEHKVYLRADARAKYGDIDTVIKEVRRAGIDHIAILADAPRPKQTL
jgi:biopolymer transport protein ExbD